MTNRITACCMVAIVSLCLAGRAPAEPTQSLDVETYANKSFEAYASAIRQDKYVLLMFHGGPYSGFCARTLKSLGDKRLARYSDKLVVSVIHADGGDEDGAMFEKRFDVKKFPTIIVLKSIPKPDGPREPGKMLRTDLVARMTGEHDAYEIDDYLRRCLDSYELKRSPDEVYEKARQAGSYLLLVFDGRQGNPTTRVFCNSTGLRKLLYERSRGNYRDSLMVAIVRPHLSDLHTEYALRFGVRKFPTYVLLKFDGDSPREIGRTAGMPDGDESSGPLDEKELRRMGIVE